jgi:nitroimidazol reductase NimA-like FMN-containing flavoprotein (pyridoxamine 5'-phosphate oxidase superfamily)
MLGPLTEQRNQTLRARGGDDQVRIERINWVQCFALLSSATVGRLGVTVDGTVEIFPVNYLLSAASSASLVSSSSMSGPAVMRRSSGWW